MLYLMREKGVEGTYKIGTSKHVDQRLREHQTGNSSDLVIEYEWQGTFEDEARLHQLLRQFKRVEGGHEWFDVTLGKILEALTIESRQHEMHLRNPVRAATGVPLGDYGPVLIHEGSHKGARALYDEDFSEDLARLTVLDSGQEVFIPHGWLTRIDRLEY